MTKTKKCKWPEDCDYPDCGTLTDPKAKICYPQTTIPMPPPCACCEAELLADHAENCNILAAMRAQAYPTTLDRNGREWYLNEIDRLQRWKSETQTTTDLCINCGNTLPIIGRCDCWIGKESKTIPDLPVLPE